ncbi:MAG: hypothetical protein ABIR24_13430 [Verrucomicrobiota bacterium]
MAREESTRNSAKDRITIRDKHLIGTMTNEMNRVEVANLVEQVVSALGVARNFVRFTNCGGVFKSKTTFLSLHRENRYIAQYECNKFRQI